MAHVAAPPFGELLKQFRSTAGLTQEQLAERAGLSARAISDLERGVKHRPHEYTVHRLVRGLDLSSEDRALLEAAGRAIGSRTPANRAAAGVGRGDGARGGSRRTSGRPAANLPVQPTHFIGRERELQAVAGLLRREDVRLLTLTGAGGTGKTRLALRAAEAVLDDYPDGVHFVPLAAVADPGLVASTVAGALGLMEAGGRDLAVALRDHLREKRLLLVLDNFEHLMAAAPLAGELLAACQGLKVLVTSRAVLRLSVERVYAVPPLSVPDLSHLPALPELARYDAVAFFADRARAARADFELTAEEAPVVAEICSRLDGLPLAIELAAARLRLFPLRALRARLSGSLWLLSAGARDRPARQQTLRGAIEWSYGLLDRHDQRLFARLSAFAGGCTPAAAEAICNPELDPQLDVLEGIGALVDQSLLRSTESTAAGEVRLTMLETIREYGLERLRESGEADEIQRRHAKYYLVLAEELEPDLWGAMPLTSLDRLEDEHDNFRCALRWGLAGGATEHQLGLRLAAALGRFWKLRGHLSEGRRWLKDFLAADEADGTPAPAIRAKALSRAGRLAFALNDVTDAKELFEGSLALHRQLGEAGGIAEALDRLAILATWQGNPQGAIQRREEGLALAQLLGDPAGIAGALLELARVALWHGHLARVAQLSEEGYELYRRLGDFAGMASALELQGTVAQNRGKSERARGLFDRCVTLVHLAGRDADVRSRLEGLALVARSRGWYERSIALYQESLDMSLALGDRREAARTCCDVARSAGEHGEYERAVALYEDSLAVFRDIGDLGGIGFALVGLGTVARDVGDAERVVELCGESLNLFRQLGDIGFVAASLHNLGVAARHQGDHGRAEKLLAESLALYREYGHAAPLAQVLGSAGLIALDRGDHSRADEAFAESLRICGIGGARWLMAMNLEGMAAVAISNGRPERAARLFGAAAAIRRAIGAPIWPSFLPLYHRHVTATRTALGDATFEAVWREGEDLTLSRALALALDEGEGPR